MVFDHWQTMPGYVTDVGSKVEALCLEIRARKGQFNPSFQSDYTLIPLRRLIADTHTAHDFSGLKPNIPLYTDFYDKL